MQAERLGTEVVSTASLGSRSNGQSHPPSDEAKELSRLTKEEWREYTKTVWQIPNVSDVDHPAVFPSAIPERLIKMFSFVGEAVLDPFAGIGTTGLVASQLGRQAILVDQNADYSARARADLRSEGVPRGTVSIRTADSRRLNWIDDASIDLAVTSPPYWNKADYGSNDANLGNIDGYLEFVESLRPVFSEVFRVLRDGRKFAVVTANVNQHTDEGLLTFPLASDLTLLLRSVGFVLVSQVIWNKDGTGGRWGSWGAQRPIFGSYPYPPNFLFKTVHEYVIIVAKPRNQKTRGAKLVPLSVLMRPPTSDS